MRTSSRDHGARVEVAVGRMRREHARLDFLDDGMQTLDLLLRGQAVVVRLDRIRVELWLLLRHCDNIRPYLVCLVVAVVDNELAHTLQVYMTASARLSPLQQTALQN